MKLKFEISEFALEFAGVQRAQISKLENGKSSITIGTLLKVMNALKAKVSFSVEKLGEVQMG
ncbi:MAG: helix-turn-helix transcriptional regulator [Saprospiraceae bacterium]